MASAANKLGEKAQEQAQVQLPPIHSLVRMLEDRKDALALADLAATYHFDAATLAGSNPQGIRELQSSLSDF